MKVLIVGAAGQLGQAMVARLGGEHEVTAWTRQDIDLTRHQDVREAIGRAGAGGDHQLRGLQQGRCRRGRAGDGARRQRDGRRHAGARGRGARRRAGALQHRLRVRRHGRRRRTPRPSTPEPRSVYAQSKLIGEWLAADAPKHYVLRVESLFGGPQRRSSVDRIVDAVRAGQPAPVFIDRVVSPSFVADVADASAFILRAGRRPASITA